MNQIFVHSRHTPIEKIEKKYPQAKVIDVTSRGTEPFVRFSPFYPLGDIPVPFSEGSFGQSVEGIWQGLKVFETDDIDTSKFGITNMKGLKRTVRKFGNVKGHRKGISGTELLDYLSARKQIYVPMYNWALEHKLQKEIEQLKALHKQSDLVLLDYETNGDIENPAKPLSHAWLVKYYLEK